MLPTVDLEALRAQLARTPSVVPAGRVRAVTGLAVRATLPGARIGEVVRIRRRGEPLDEARPPLEQLCELLRGQLPR